MKARGKTQEGEQMNIRVLDDYEIRGRDSANLQVWQYKAIESGDRKGEMDWVALNSYHQTVEGAVEWIYKHAQRCLYRGVEADLEGAIGLLRGIEKDVGRHARAFGKAVRNAAD